MAIWFRRMSERQSYSLAARLALITAAWSAVALLVTGVVLMALFRRDAEREFDARILADLVNLVRDASAQPAGDPALPVKPLGPLFDEPFSGWAWQVRRRNEIIAQSGSLGPMVAGVMEPLLAPASTPADFIAPGGIPSRGAQRSILLSGHAQPLVFSVARPRAEIDDSLSYFSQLLLYSLAVFGVVMFAASLLLARIMLAPVQRLQDAVRRLRDGETAQLDQAWPREIVPVIGELRTLNAHIGTLIERSRNQASDLAHALKTPLSIMRQSAENAPAGAAELLTQQINRMQDSLDWHLTRRRLAGPRYGRVEIGSVVEDVLFAMSKLFGERAFTLEHHVETGVAFNGDEEDLQEILGNLAENACKWARQSVRITASATGHGLEIRVDDDGPGIPDDVAEAVFRRGARFDESAPGHGHGLAIVRTITELYGGLVEIGTSELGGTSVSVHFPHGTATGPG
jgi:signal transduction histidine kinase